MQGAFYPLKICFLIPAIFVDEKLKEWSKSTTAKEIIYLFNDGSTESTEFLERIFQAPIAEIRSDEGN